MVSSLVARSLQSPVVPSAVVAKRALLPCLVRLVPRHAFSTSLVTDDNQDRVIILGAAGRDFHDFQVYYSRQTNTQVMCFTGTQIPGIDHRMFPPEMCHNDKNGNLYAHGLKIYNQDNLEDLIDKYDATTCALAYSDLSYDTVQGLASRANASGCKFLQLPPKLTQLVSLKPVVSICASRTGVGKSQTTRYVANYLKQKGLKVAVVRHPMPYAKDLNSQRCQRYEQLEDMDKYHCTVEEREEYFLHIEDGNLLFAGVDYEMILRTAEKEADVIIWDGGNNDLPFYKPDLHICLVDSLRPTDEEHYYPGETNVRLSDMILVTKVNSLPDGMQQAHDHAEHLRAIIKPYTPVFFGKSVVTPEAKNPDTGELLSEEDAAAMIKGKKVLVIDDGPTLTHGGMAYGAGYAMAKGLEAAEIVDPRPYAAGSLKGVFDKFTHIKNVLPAMGYSDEQIKDLADTIHATPCDTVIIGTPSDLTDLMDLERPSVVARYELELVEEHDPQFHEVLDTFYERFYSHHHSAA